MKPDRPLPPPAGGASYGIPIWQHGARTGGAAAAPARAELPARADVVVVGGGFTGLATALVLARSGQNVVLLEQGEIGHGASSKNAGFCTMSPPASASAILSQYGEVEGARYFQWFHRAVALVQQLAAEEGLDIALRTSGRLSLARSGTQSLRLKNNFDIQRKYFGLPVEYVEGNDLREHIGAPGFFSAIMDDCSACLNPGMLVAELLRAGSRHGVSIRENCTVDGIRESPGGVEVRCAGAVVNAKHVVVATNGYGKSLGLGVNNFTVPLGSYIIATRPLSDAERGKLLPTGKIASTISNYSNYFRILDDGTLLFGGRKSLASNSRLDTVSAELLDSAKNLLRGIEIPPVLSCWGGRLAFTADRTPLVGKVSDRVYYAGGYCGHGVPTSISSGFAVARHILRSPDLDCPFFSERIRGSIKNLIGRNVMPAVGLYYRWRDHRDLKDGSTEH